MQIEIIGAPIDFGAGRRGVEMGAAAMRLAGLVDRVRARGPLTERDYHWLHDTHGLPRDLVDGLLAEAS